MFSGLIEACHPIQKVQEFNGLIRIWVQRPESFDDVKIGDSIAVNGICLTVEAFDEAQIQFALGHETLQALQIQKEHLLNKRVNLERSLRFGDRLHGHLVSGHVEALGSLLQRTQQGDSLVLKIGIPTSLRPAIWKKGSIAVHGVSLTINDVGPAHFEVCLIPETLKKTNLNAIVVGDSVHLETDYLAKALFERWQFSQKENANGF